MKILLLIVLKYMNEIIPIWLTPIKTVNVVVVDMLHTCHHYLPVDVSALLLLTFFISLIKTSEITFIIWYEL